MIGQSIAHYKIVEKIGAGGMGEVYRAHDEKLNRDVALKILPPAYAADSDRMARFQREARLLASLNHANIASIYGLEEGGGVHAIVLELVEGEDLAVTLRARTFGIEEALDIAVQVAEALDFAHDAGIVHRDLKPANVKVTPEGKVKVLDFGLAKAFLDDSNNASDAGMTMSPTMSVAASAAGVILGTAAYMSPEQARGKQVDRRADIWAFGVLLFEMLSGKQLFRGETISDTLAGVIKDDPDWRLLPPDTPALVVEIMRRCLEKSPRRRLQSIGEARIALEELLHGSKNGPGSVTLLSSSFAHAALDSTPAVERKNSRRPAILLWLLSIVVVGVGATFFGMRMPSSPEHTLARRFHLDPEGYQAFYPIPPALSPDGRHVAYFTGSGLSIRDLHSLESIDIPGTQRATAPFWSPDAAWLAFGMEGKIHKVAAQGGNPSIICDVPFGTLDGGAWGEDEMLYLAPNAGPLYVVSERGGDAKPLFTPNTGESDYHTPSVLPAAKGVVFTTHNPNGRDTIELYVNGERRVLLHIPGARLEYTAWSALAGSASKGHLVFHRQNTNSGIWAMPFDLSSLEVVGDAFLIDSNGAFPSVAKDGSLLYSVGSAGGMQQLVLVNRKGEILSRIGQPQLAMTDPRIAPDGSGVLVSAMEGDSRDIWLHDVQRGTRTKMTFSNEMENHPNWRDSGTITFSRATANAKTYSCSADGSSEPQLVTEGYHMSIVPGSDLVAFSRFLSGTGQDIFYQKWGSDEPAKPFLQTPSSEVGGEISPDGRYLIYMSDESGGNEIYMKPFPQGEGKWQISTSGGAWAKWSKAGDEIIYRSGAEAGASMISVAVRTTPTVQLGTPVVLFTATEVPQLSFRSGFASYDLTLDPETLIMLERVDQSTDPEARMVFSENWYESYRGNRN